MNGLWVAKRSSKRTKASPFLEAGLDSSANEDFLWTTQSSFWAKPSKICCWFLQVCASWPNKPHSDRSPRFGWKKKSVDQTDTAALFYDMDHLHEDELLEKSAGIFIWLLYSERTAANLVRLPHRFQILKVDFTLLWNFLLSLPKRCGEIGCQQLWCSSVSNQERFFE